MGKKTGTPDKSGGITYHDEHGKLAGRSGPGAAVDNSENLALAAEASPASVSEGKAYDVVEYPQFDEALTLVRERTGEPADRHTGTGDERLDEALATAIQNIPLQKATTKEEYWTGYTILVKSDGRYSVVGDDSFTEPTERPLLPWSKPLGTPVATVSIDGVITVL